MSWDLWATRLPYIEVYGTHGSLAVPNPDRFDDPPCLRRAGPEELRQPPPAPGELRWTPCPVIRHAHAGRGTGIAEMADAIDAARPHRAGPDLACHVLEVLSALEATALHPGTTEIKSRCERPAPL